MSKEPIFYGGQAVIGGVLINSPKGWSLAVRNESGDVQRCFNKRVPIVKRNSFFGAPLIRGISALLDSLIVGYKGLELSEKIFYSHNEVDRNIFTAFLTSKFQRTRLFRSSQFFFKFFIVSSENIQYT